MWKNLELITKQNQELNSGKMKKYQLLLEEKDKITKEKEVLKIELNNQQSIKETTKKELHLNEMMVIKNEKEFIYLDQLENETELQLMKNEERILNNYKELDKLKASKE